MDNTPAKNNEASSVNNEDELIVSDIAIDDSSYKIFQAISDFINCLEFVFGRQFKSLALYNRLVNKTTREHVTPIKKHISVFSEFCSINSYAINERDYNLLAQNNISYSERVYIPLDQIFQKANKDTSNIMWQHLVTINALINPSPESYALVSTVNKPQVSDDDFINDIINVVSSSINPETVSAANPIDTAMSLISSGKLQNIITTMTSHFENGTLNYQSLLSKVIGMYSNVSGGEKNDIDIQSIINTIGNIQNINGFTNTK